MFLDQPYHQTRMLLLDGLCSATRGFFGFFLMSDDNLFIHASSMDLCQSYSRPIILVQIESLCGRPLSPDYDRQ